MNKELFFDVYKLLMPFEGLPVAEVRLLLRTALEVIEKHSYLDLNQFTEKNEVIEDEWTE